MSDILEPIDELKQYLKQDEENDRPNFIGDFFYTCVSDNELQKNLETGKNKDNDWQLMHRVVLDVYHWIIAYGILYHKPSNKYFRIYCSEELNDYRGFTVNPEPIEMIAKQELKTVFYKKENNND